MHLFRLCKYFLCSAAKVSRECQKAGIVHAFRQVDGLARRGLAHRLHLRPTKFSNLVIESIMSLLKVPAGAKAPDVFNVIIEIPANADPIKYEIDHETGAVFVDRFMGTAMHYPCNYGYVPQTIAPDGDPVDVLVVTPFPLLPGVVIPCRPLGILKMEDEAGGDSKLVAVPTEKICAMYKDIQKMEDLPVLLVSQIKHFFEHYKDLEPGKWVKVTGWDGIDAAKAEVTNGLAAFAKGH
jgi:inorganic pyrophosphatase